MIALAVVVGVSSLVTILVAPDFDLLKVQRHLVTSQVSLRVAAFIVLLIAADSVEWSPILLPTRYVVRR